MELAINTIKDRGLWDDFVTSQPRHTFLHAWAWGEVNDKEGDPVWHLGLFDKDTLIGTALLIKVHAKRGNFLFVPHGPILNAKMTQDEKRVAIGKLVEHFKKIAKQESVNFIRISPLMDRDEKTARIFKTLGFRAAPIHMHAEVTWTLDLDKSEDELLADMRKTTRNLIRRAKKEDVEILEGTSRDYLDEFLKLYRETARRHSFVPFSDAYLEGELNAFAKTGHAKIFLAKWQGITLSAAMIVFHGTSAFYHHGANSWEHQKIPAAYLLQWHAIQEARTRGKKHYNFWGIAENEEDTSHPWYGLTFFKKGFGGYRTEYLHAQDLPLKRTYWLAYGIDTLRRLRRHL